MIHFEIINNKFKKCISSNQHGWGTFPNKQNQCILRLIVY